MIPRIIAFCILFLPVVLSAQENDTINRYDEDGLRTGYWEKTTPDGKLIYQGYFIKGKPTGEMRRYYESGELKAVMAYNEGSEKVRTCLYYTDGELAAKGTFCQNTKDSLWTYYSYYSGAVTSTEMYVGGQKHGWEKKFYDSGQLAEEVEWNNNVKHGRWNQYFEDGVLKQLAFYSYGKVTGPYFFYWPNGNKYIQGQFVDNLRHGKWSFYTDEGKIKWEIDYRYGMAENEDEIIKQDQEFFKMVEENIQSGKFQDPTIEDLMPEGRGYY